MIILERVSYGYGDRRVLDSISFSIPRGQIWALLGKSGSGKTTLLHIISGLYKPLSGTVRINGNDNHIGLIKGVIFQDECLLGWLSVFENLLFPHHKKCSETLIKRASTILAQIGLSDNRDSHPFELSTGMRKRLEFGRALMADDNFILADEPFGTVDAITRRKLWELWVTLRRKQERTGILCTHDPEEAIRLCDAIMILNDNSPSILDNIISIPDSVRDLDIKAENEELLKLKIHILEMLMD